MPTSQLRWVRRAGGPRWIRGSASWPISRSLRTRRWPDRARTHRQRPSRWWTLVTADWMQALAEHVQGMRVRYPGDELVVVFDIDGTIVDARYLTVHVLLSYD